MIPDIMINDKILLKLDDQLVFDAEIWTGILRQQLTRIEKDYLILVKQKLFKKRQLESNIVSYTEIQQYIDDFLEKILWGKCQRK